MIPLAETFFDNVEIEEVLSTVKSGWVTRGEKVRKFEKEFSRYVNTKYAVAVFNGTVALHAALAAIGVSSKDEVIIPTLTFISTANSVSYCNARIRLSDSDKDTYTIDPTKIEERITEKTKAIIPVHLYGHPCDMDPIMEIAEKHDLIVIEDSAEAHGAEYKGKKVGSIGNMGCFSFYGNKIITTGEGGMITTNNEELYEKIEMLINVGRKKGKRYWHDSIGFNYRMTDLQAALGIAQMKKIEKIIEKKRIVAEWYSKRLKEIKEFTEQKEAEWAKCVYWLYSPLFNSEKVKRDELIQRMKDFSIELGYFFPCIHKQPCYSELKINNNHPIAEKLSESGLNLPSSFNLEKDKIDFICNKISDIINS